MNSYRLKFKYRVWNEYDKDFDYFDLARADQPSFHPTSQTIEDMEQCTGETDKEDVLVYQGDIVQGIGPLYKVIWCEDLTGFIGRNIKIDEETGEITEQSAGIMLRMKHKKVVGNIHEGVK